MKPITKTLVFYEPYKPLPTASQKRIRYFRNKLRELIDLPELYRFPEKLVRINLLSPVMRSQEERKIGRIKSFETITKDTKASTPRKYFPSTTSTTPKGKEPPKKPKPMPRAIGNRNQFLRDSKGNRKITFIRDKNVKAPKFFISQTVLPHETLLKIKLKVEKEKITEKVKKAMKYLKNFGPSRRFFVRSTHTPPLTPMPMYRQEESKLKRSYLSKSITANTSYQLPIALDIENLFPADNVKQEIKNTTSMNRKVNNGSKTSRPFNPFIDALEELALSPIGK